MHQVFIVMSTRFDGSAAIVEIRGVFARMDQASQYANDLRTEGLRLRITRHAVIESPVPAGREGVQADPTVDANRTAGRTS